MHAGIERRGRACRPVQSSAPWLTWYQAKKRWPAPRPPDCERRQENPDETKAVPRTAVQRLLSRRDILLREKTLRRMLYETAARGGDPRDRRAGPRPGQPPGAHPVQRRRDPMGVLGHRHRPPAPALAGLFAHR